MIKKDFVVFAHRGASEYAPENTLMSFNLGVFMGANGIETDVQKTRDGVLVLFHDDTLERVTGEKGSVADYTFEELQRFNVKKNERYDKIVKFEDFLRFFSFRDLTFAIELKHSGYEKETVDMIRKFGIEDKTTVTSFKFACLRAVHMYAPDLRLGYLKSTFSEEELKACIENGVGEVCPKAQEVTPERMTHWRESGFKVRAWGVTNEDDMKRVFDLGCDGTTVNFPDKLIEYINNKTQNEVAR